MINSETFDKIELLKKQQFLSAADIQKMFDCGRGKAYQIIRGIKSVSDIAHLSGKVTVSDYLAWYNQYQK